MKTPLMEKRLISPRWFQFSLRAVFVSVIAISIVLGWITQERRRVADARRVLERRILDFGEQPRWRYWLFGSDPVRHAITIDGWELRDNELAHLSRCVELRRLYLNDTQITDAGIKHLSALTTLTHLDLSFTQVTDAGLMQLKRLSRLERLDVEETSITKSCLERMRIYWPKATFHGSKG